MIDKNIYIKNIYYMLSYAFRALQEKEYVDIQGEKFDNIYDILAIILSKGIGDQIKRGILRGYISIDEITSMPKGKIQISESIIRNTQSNNKLFCIYDEFSKNIYMNQIIKTVLFYLLKKSDIKSDSKKKIKKVIIYFSNVDLLDIHHIQWSRLKYNRNNITYRMIIGICKLIADNSIINETSGNRRVKDFIDDQNMNKLYEKFVLEFYKKHFSQLKPEASIIDWDISSDDTGFLPSMKTDITLRYENKKLIIDTKYYSQVLQQNFDKKSIHSGNLYQIFTYVKNADINNDESVSGMLLYAKTNEEIIPNETHVIKGSKISVRTLDLNREFDEIKNQLEGIAEEFIG